MFVKFNDDSKTLLDINQAILLDLYKNKINFQLKNDHALYNVIFDSEEDAKKDFDQLSTILRQRGFMEVNSHLVLKSSVVAFSREFNDKCINLVLNNERLTCIEFDDDELMKICAESLEREIMEFIECVNL